MIIIPLQAVAHFWRNKGPVSAVNKATVWVQPSTPGVANASFIMFACDLYWKSYFQ